LLFRLFTATGWIGQIRAAAFGVTDGVNE